MGMDIFLHMCTISAYIYIYICILQAGYIRHSLSLFCSFLFLSFQQSWEPYFSAIDILITPPPSPPLTNIDGRIKRCIGVLTVYHNTPLSLIDGRTSGRFERLSTPAVVSTVFPPAVDSTVYPPAVVSTVYPSAVVSTVYPLPTVVSTV